jgi:hypothetical protein
MSTTAVNLRVLDEPSVSRELDLITELFHRINRIIPENQKLLTVSPDITVRETVAKMKQHGYSQIPVLSESSSMSQRPDEQQDFFETEAARSLLDQLLTDSRLYTQSKDYKELLDFVVRLRNFAPFNAMLLQVQKPQQ